jgi:hypothetical protein
MTAPQFLPQLAAREPGAEWKVSGPAANPTGAECGFFMPPHWGGPFPIREQPNPPWNRGLESNWSPNGDAGRAPSRAHEQTLLQFVAPLSS